MSSKIADILEAALEFRKRKVKETTHLSAPGAQVLVDSCDEGLVWLKYRESMVVVLREGLKALGDEIYASEPFDQKEQYKRVDEAVAWLDWLEGTEEMENGEKNENG